MPLSPMQFQITGDPMSQGLMDAIQRGMQMGYMPKQMNADIALKQAEAQRAQQQANLPFGGATLPGASGQILALESVKQMFGEDSPQYKQAVSAFNLGQQSDQSRINYQNALTGTLPIRALTSTGKGFIEETNVAGGKLPTGQEIPGGSSFDPQRAKEIYGLTIQKGSTDTDTRKRNLFASNIENTLNQIDPNALAQYAGIEGGLKKSAEAGKAMFGKESPDYDNYLTSKVGVQMLAKQVRQFYGDSIQPQVKEDLEKLADPSTFRTNPQLALKLFNKNKDILTQELGIYRQALKSQSAYGDKTVYPGGITNVPTSQAIAASPLTVNPQQAQGLAAAGIAQPAPQPVSQPIPQAIAGAVIVQTPDGQYHQVDRNKVQNALSKYPGTKVVS
jgi:hypothetical protein